MSRYRAETFRLGTFHGYRILEGDREVLRSGAFLHERDAARVGSHFAADDDLALHLNR